MSRIPADQLINVLKSLVSAERDSELAQTLGVGKSTIASWRRRGIIPKQILDRAFAELGLTEEYINRWLRDEASTSHLLLGISFYHAVLRLGATLKEADLFEIAGLLYRFDDDIKARLTKHAAPQASSGGSDAITTASAVMDGRVLGPDELMSLLLEAQARAKPVPQ